MPNENDEPVDELYANFTPDAIASLEAATRESRRFHHMLPGAEHLLLALLRAPSRQVYALFASLDVDPRNVRLELEKILYPGPCVISPGKVPRTPRLMRVLELAAQQAQADNTLVTAGHLLLAISQEGTNIPAMVFNTLGLTTDAIKSALHRGIAASFAPASPPAALPPDDPAVTKRWYLVVYLSGIPQPIGFYVANRPKLEEQLIRVLHDYHSNSPACEKILVIEEAPTFNSTDRETAVVIEHIVAYRFQEVGS